MGALALQCPDLGSSAARGPAPKRSAQYVRVTAASSVGSRRDLTPATLATSLRDLDARRQRVQFWDALRKWAAFDTRRRHARARRGTGRAGLLLIEVDFLQLQEGADDCQRYTRLAGLGRLVISQCPVNRAAGLAPRARAGTAAEFVGCRSMDRGRALYSAPVSPRSRPASPRVPLPRRQPGGPGRRRRVRRC